MTEALSENSGEVQARRLEKVYDQMKTLLEQSNVAQRLRTNPGENEWSAMEILGHMVEMIPYWLYYCRKIIAATGDLPSLGRAADAPERLAGVEQGATGDPEELLRLLNGEVQTAVQAIRQMSAAERDKKGVNPNRGEMTVAEVIEVLIVAHAEDHLAQMQAALQT